MNKQTTTTIMTHLRWGAFFLVLLFLGFQVIPRAIGQRDASKRSSDVEIPLLKQQPPPLEPAVCSSWAATGSLNTGRYFHTATLLPNGMMLVAGGFSTGGASTSAELYDPASGSWTATGSLNTARYLHTATLLPNGMVLVAGGRGSSIRPSASAELYDPASGTWTTTGSLNTGRQDHTATLLPNGIVLVAGGLDSNGNISASAELYDPASGTWTTTGSLNTGRYLHSAT